MLKWPFSIFHLKKKKKLSKNVVKIWINRKLKLASGLDIDSIYFEFVHNYMVMYVEFHKYAAR